MNLTGLLTATTRLVCLVPVPLMTVVSAADPLELAGLYISIRLCGNSVRLVTCGLTFSLRVAPTLAGTACNVVYMFTWLWHMPMWKCSKLLTVKETLSLRLLPKCLTLNLPATIPIVLHARLPAYMSNFPVGCSPLLMCSTGGLPTIKRKLDVPSLISRWTVDMNLLLVLGRLACSARLIRLVPTPCLLGMVLLLVLPALGIMKLVNGSARGRGRSTRRRRGRGSRKVVLRGTRATAGGTRRVVALVTLVRCPVNGAVFGMKDGGPSLTRRTGLRLLHVGPRRAVLALLLNRRSLALIGRWLSAAGKIRVLRDRRTVRAARRRVIDRLDGRDREIGRGLGTRILRRSIAGTEPSEVKTFPRSLLLVRTVPLED